MTIVRSYSTVGEAESARSALDAAGIEAWVGDENIVSIYWLTSNAVGGVKVCVRPEDSEVAAEILGNAAQEAPEEADDVQHPVPADTLEKRCPRCGSTEFYRLRYRRLKVMPMFVSIAIFVIAPIALLLPRRKCDACGRLSWRA